MADKPEERARAEIAQYLLAQARQGVRFIAGIDHGCRRRSDSRLNSPV